MALPSNLEWLGYEYGDEIICPYCKYEYSDSWDFGWGSREHIEVKCDECGKDFEVYQEVSVEYRTYPKEEKQA